MDLKNSVLMNVDAEVETDLGGFPGEYRAVPRLHVFEG